MDIELYETEFPGMYITEDMGGGTSSLMKKAISMIMIQEISLKRMLWY